MSHVADSPINRHFEPISGRFAPIRPQIIAASGMGYPLLGTRETWVVPTVFLTTVLLSRAPRPTPDQRDQVVRGPSPAGECLTPTAELRKTERGPISTSEPSISLCAEPGDSCGQIHPFLPTRHRSPVDRSLVAKALNPSLFRHACQKAISRNACSLLDFPEFAQAVRYGVLASGKLWKGGRDLNSETFR